MTDRVRVRYSFKGIEEYEQTNQKVRKIILEDTKEENWIETRSMPPLGFPPPLTTEAAAKLKGLESEGVTITELEDD